MPPPKKASVLTCILSTMRPQSQALPQGAGSGELPVPRSGLQGSRLETRLVAQGLMHGIRKHCKKQANDEPIGIGHKPVFVKML